MTFKMADGVITTGAHAHEEHWQSGSIGARGDVAVEQPPTKTSVLSSSLSGLRPQGKRGNSVSLMSPVRIAISTAILVGTSVLLVVPCEGQDAAVAPYPGGADEC